MPPPISLQFVLIEAVFPLFWAPETHAVIGAKVESGNHRMGAAVKLM